MTITLPDLASFIWFVAAWIVYSIVIERSAKGRTGLNALMNRYRDEWMERLLERDIRMVLAEAVCLRGSQGVRARRERHRCPNEA